MASDEIRDGDSVHTAVSDLRSDVTAIQDMLTDILARTSALSASIPSAPIVSSKFPVCLLFFGCAGDVLGARARRAGFFHATVLALGRVRGAKRPLGVMSGWVFAASAALLRLFCARLPPIAGRVAVSAPVPLP